ncbi:GNAT family N-acetyltransferase [Billgrantia kenyensis]|uniref:GNAT family N-acetyltransferase n=1 Tax=Billgrantia kenyensis TaxID=321266 RepID=A0A7W0AEN2_9GAMM|nr:GNAT family N-acetyltransferase [Halomonas kenyensis]MBA2780308.1 GNAT family N-acetyltransferase [Halomonas kenyensis]MCG6663224.1 GNAT family N-acetyltransferase [Halomonas kenyensis]
MRLASRSLYLAPAHERHLALLQSWFPDAEHARLWGGPGIRYPFTAESFHDDLQLESVTSRALLNDRGSLLGFGQYCRRHERCHLMRLAIAPAHRGQGLGARLIAALAREGGEALRVTECALNVYPNNPAARLYARLGFSDATPPDGQSLDGCRYLVASVSVASRDNLEQASLAVHKGLKNGR